MALVAYSDNSDVGTDSEDDGEGQKADEWKASANPSESVDSAELSGVNTIEDEEEEFVGGKATSTGLFSSVPAAVPVTSLLEGAQEEVEDELVDVPTVETWKVTQELKKQNNNETGPSGFRADLTKAATKERKRVKIFIPSLSEVS